MRGDERALFTVICGVRRVPVRVLVEVWVRLLLGRDHRHLHVESAPEVSKAHLWLKCVISDLASESEILGEDVVRNHVELLLLLALHIYASPASFVARHSGNACTINETSNDFACLRQRKKVRSPLRNSKSVQKFKFG